MKVLQALFLAVVFSGILLSTEIYAQGSKLVSKEAVAKKAFDIVPESLNSKIPGIVESTIFNLVEIKKYYPYGNYSDIIGKLNKIAKNYPDTAIRVKAYLASIYLSSDNIINVEPRENYFNHDYIFKQIAEQLESKLLVSK